MADESQIPSVLLETPKDKTHGDYSTNMAMQLARIAKAPRQIAEELVASFDKGKASIEKMDIVRLYQLYMNNSYLTKLIPSVLEAGEHYGETNIGQGEKIQVEFVSNPTGDLHLYARAAVGDALCSVLSKAGYDVSREYYINDAGNQINNLALSVEVRYFEALYSRNRCRKTVTAARILSPSGKACRRFRRPFRT